jgi:type II secretory ATPase GspE/PulE/Tfp pilus assembly ATPase PilB-like protein
MFLEKLFQQAMKLKVSDIHFEPQEEVFFIKFRLN